MGFYLLCNHKTDKPSTCCDDFRASINANEGIPADPSPVNLPVNPVTPTNGSEDQPEKMRAASGGPILDLRELIHGDDDPMEVDPSPSPFVPGKIITSPVIDGTSAGQQIPGGSDPNHQTSSTYDSFDDGEQSAFG